MGPRAATIAKLEQLEREHRMMRLANRYLVAGKPEMLREIGLPQAEAQRVIRAGGYTGADLTKIRDTIRYYRTKSRRRLWLPDPGETAT